MRKRARPEVVVVSLAILLGVTAAGYFALSHGVGSGPNALTPGLAGKQQGARRERVSHSGRVDAGHHFVGNQANRASGVWKFESAPRALENGRITAIQGGHSVTVPIHSGLWELPANSFPGRDWVITEVWSDDSKLRFLPVRFRNTEPIELVAYGYDGVFVVCKDGDGNELADISVHVNDSGRASPSQINSWHPGNVGLIAQPIRGGSSPIYLPSLQAGRFPFWLHTPGLVWESVTAKQTRESDVLELVFRPAGVLNTHIRNFHYRSNLYLALYRGDRLVSTYRPLLGPGPVFQGLLPGDFELFLMAENLPSRERALAGSEKIHVTVGLVTDVVLDAPDLPGPEDFGSLSGSLTIQASELWSDTHAFQRAELVLGQESPTAGFRVMRRDQKHLRITRMDILDAASWNPLRLWSIPVVPAGDYVLTIAPFGIKTFVTVQAGKTEHVNLVLPPLARTVIELSAGGMPVEDVLLSASTPGGSSALGEYREADQWGETSVITLVTLPGELTLLGDVPEFPPLRDSLHVLAGWNHHRVAMVDSPQVTLRAIDEAGQEVSVDWWFDVTVRPGGSPGHLVDRTAVSVPSPTGKGNRVSRGNFFFSDKGKYVFIFPQPQSGLRSVHASQIVNVGNRSLESVLVIGAE